MPTSNTHLAYATSLNLGKNFLSTQRLRAFFLSTALWLVFTSVSSQSQTIDSLQKIIDARSGVGKWEPTYELAFSYLYINQLENCLKTISAALDIALKSSDTLKICKSTRVKAQILGKLNRTDEQIKIFLQLLPILERNNFQVEYIISLNSLANAYIILGQYDVALRYHFISLEKRRERGDVREIAMALHNIGLVYYKLEAHQKAIVFNEEASRLYASLTTPDCDGMALALLNASLCYAAENDFDCARDYLQKALSVSSRDFLNVNIVDITFNKGLIAYGSGDYENAKEYFLHSYDSAKQRGNLRFELESACWLADIFMREEKFRAAFQYLSAIEDKINHISFRPEKLRLYYRLARLRLIQQDYERAAIYQQKYISLKDSLYGFRFTTNTMKVESEQLERENSNRLRTQGMLLYLKEQEIRQQTLINAITIAFAVTFLMLTVMVITAYLRKKKVNMLLEKRVRERTKELEIVHNYLINSIYIKDSTFNKTLHEVKTRIDLIRGISSLALKDNINSQFTDYLEKIDYTILELSAYLKAAKRHVTEINVSLNDGELKT